MECHFVQHRGPPHLVVPNRAAHQNHQGALSQWEQPLIEQLPCALPNLSIPSLQQPSKGGVHCIDVGTETQRDEMPKVTQMTGGRSHLDPKWSTYPSFWPLLYIASKTQLPVKPLVPWPLNTHVTEHWSLTSLPYFADRNLNSQKRASSWGKRGKFAQSKVNSAADGYPLHCPALSRMQLQIVSCMWTQASNG